MAPILWTALNASWSTRRSVLILPLCALARLSNVRANLGQAASAIPCVFETGSVTLAVTLL
jgi:hypothetical protein